MISLEEVIPIRKYRWTTLDILRSLTTGDWTLFAALEVQGEELGEQKKVVPNLEREMCTQ
ncbi:unnamed protein product [Coregonus sp. 'balchen']|nr:unnamed protein product [Coregonus sp. 'balchen']